MKVKICGIKDVQTALEAVESGADALGFVFAESKRKLSPQQARDIISQLPNHILKVGVFVNETKENIEEVAQFCGLTHVQLHGDETQEFINKLAFPVIKAFNIGTPEDLKKIERYNCEYVLLDSPKGKYHGGTGIPFDWAVSRSADFTGKKVILAGGLHAANVKEAIDMVNPYMVDVSSGVETDGHKDTGKIKEFIKEAKETGGITV